MQDLIIVKEDKCVGCNACVRTCPAPEANITKQLNDGRFVTTVNYSKCIACGECVRNCAHGARDYVDDTEAAMNVLSKRQRCIVIAAPAIKSVYPDHWKSILNWFKSKGCLIYDVSFGADICTWAHLRAIQNKKVGNVISQPCAAIVKYVETYQPTLLKNLSPVHSPMLCAVTYIRQYLRRTEPIIALSPCIAKKNEFLETGLVDYNVTFSKMFEYFAKTSTVINKDFSDDFKYDFEYMQGQVGAVYPRPGGLRDNLWLHDPDINITTSEGVHKVYPELDMYATLPETKKPEVFDVLSCEFGCNVGAGTGTKRTVFDVMETMREVEREAKTYRKVSGGFFRGAEDKLFKQFDEQLNLQDFLRTYNSVVPTPVPSDANLEPIYEMMGKHTVEERNFNCHACGYRSCKEMAVAIYRGLNAPSNCIVHAKNVLLAHHSELAQRHEELSEIAAKCKELSERLDKDVESISGKMSNIRETNSKTTDRAGNVKALMVGLRDFCNQHTTLDEESLKQMLEIITTLIASFESVDEYVGVSNKETIDVDNDIREMKELVVSVNTTLGSLTT